MIVLVPWSLIEASYFWFINPALCRWNFLLEDAIFLMFSHFPCHAKNTVIFKHALHVWVDNISNLLIFLQAGTSKHLVSWKINYLMIVRFTTLLYSSDSKLLCPSRLKLNLCSIFRLRRHSVEMGWIEKYFNSKNYHFFSVEGMNFTLHISLISRLFAILCCYIIWGLY